MTSSSLPDSASERERTEWAMGIDIGTTNTKLIALGLDEHLPVFAQRSSRTSDDPEDLWSFVAAAVIELCAQLGCPPVAVGIASMAETGCLLDRTGRPLTPLLRWNHARPTTPSPGADERREHFHRTGVRLAPKTTWSMLRQLRRDRPGLLGTAHRWVGTADLVHLRLTGSHRTDATLAGRTGLYPLPAPEQISADRLRADLANSIGMTPDLFPTVTSLPDPAILGPLDTIPVLVAGHDHSVAAWAVGMRAPGVVVDSVGTSEAILRIAPHPVDRDAALDQGMSVVRPIEGGAEAVLAGSPAAGEMVRLWRAAAGERRLPRSVAELGDRSEQLATLLAPYPGGRQCPAPDPGARVRTTDARELADVPGRALLESLSLHAAWMAQEVAGLSGGAEHEQIFVGSALTRNRAWAALKASLVPTTCRLVEVEEVTAAGAALLASVRVGAIAAHRTLAQHGVAPLPPERAASYRDALPDFIRFATHPAPPKGTHP